MSNFCFAELDSVAGSYYYYYVGGPANPANGSFTITPSLNHQINALVTGYDDVNNNGNLDPGEGWGWWDKDGSGGTGPDGGDVFTLQPGQQVSGVQVVLQTQDYGFGVMRSGGILAR